MLIYNIVAADYSIKLFWRRVKSSSYSARGLLRVLLLVSLGCGFIVWVPDHFRAYTLRYFFLLVAGILAFACIYRRRSYLPLPRYYVFFLVACLACMAATIVETIFYVTPLWRYPQGSSAWHNALLGVPVWHPGYILIVVAILVAISIDARRLFNSLGFYYCGVGYAVASLLVHLLYPYQNRLIGLDLQSNSTALLLSIFFILGLKWHEGLKTGWVLIGQLIIAGVLVLTQSRLMIFGVLVVVGLELYRHRAILNIWLLALVGVLGGMVIVLLSSRLSLLYLEQSIVYRLELWQVGMVMAGHVQPLGAGAGSIANSLLVYGGHNNMLANTIQHNYIFDSTHNLLIDRLIEWGIAGFMLYIVTILQAVRLAWRQGDKSIFYSIVIVLLYSIANNSFLSTEVVLWLVLLTPIKLSVDGGKIARRGVY